MKILRYDLLAILLSLSVFLLFTRFGLQRQGETGFLLIEDAQGESLYPLSEDRELVLWGPVGQSVVRIEEGKARFVSSDCPDDLCVHMGEIYRVGEWAACLPNRIFISTQGGEAQREVDALVY